MGTGRATAARRVVSTGVLVDRYRPRTGRGSDTQRLALVPRAPAGNATFLPFARVQHAIARLESTPAELDRFFRDLVVADTNLGPQFKDRARVWDHHGVYAIPQPINATMQLLEHFERTLQGENGDIDAAIAALNLAWITTDNLADGAWCVWCAQHQRRVLTDAALRALVREATFFEDFVAFNGSYDRTTPAVELQAALFSRYGEILLRCGVTSSDRLPAGSEVAQTMMEEATAAIGVLLEDGEARQRAAEDFWADLDSAMPQVTAARVASRILDGRPGVAIFDLSALARYSIFVKWLAVPVAAPDLTVQVTMDPVSTVEGGASPRSILIAALPHGRTAPWPIDLTQLIPTLNDRERDLAGADGPAAQWFGRPSVILPTPTIGSRIPPEQFADLLMAGLEAMCPNRAV